MQTNLIKRNCLKFAKQISYKALYANKEGGTKGGSQWPLSHAATICHTSFKTKTICWGYKKSKADDISALVGPHPVVPHLSMRRRTFRGPEEPGNFEVLATCQRQLIIALDGETHFKFDFLVTLRHQQLELHESIIFCACFFAV